MKIRVKLLNNQALPVINETGDWYDLMINTDINLKGPSAETLKRTRVKGEETSVRGVSFYPELVSLDFSMQLPKGFEAVVLPRSSTFRKYAIQLANTEGVIDNCYNGTHDIWSAHILPFKTVIIPEGTRLFQFRIQLSQRATIFQKLRWLFWNGKVTFISVDKLNDKNRGGNGSTGN